MNVLCVLCVLKSVVLVLCVPELAYLSIQL